MAEEWRPAHGMDVGLARNARFEYDAVDRACSDSVDISGK